MRMDIIEKPLVIIGTGGHGRELLRIIESSNHCYFGNQGKFECWNVLGFLNDDQSSWDTTCAGYHILPGGDNFVLNYDPGKYENQPLSIVVAIGSPAIREKIVKKFEALHKDNIIQYPNLIHPNAMIRNVCGKEDRGFIAAPGSITTENVHIGNHVHLNTRCTICHDVIIGNYSIVSPGATICGNVTIGERVYIGAGATIRDGIEIASDTVIGAGAVVVKNIKVEGETFVGVPARVLI